MEGMGKRKGWDEKEGEDGRASKGKEGEEEEGKGRRERKPKGVVLNWDCYRE